MKKKLMLLLAVCSLAVGALAGCSCSPQSKFVGTWEGKTDYESTFKKEFGEAQSPDEAKFLGDWKGSKNNDLGLKSDHTTTYGTVWELTKENGQEIVILNDVQPASNDSEKQIIVRFIYDENNNTLTSEGAIVAETGEEPRYYHRYAKGTVLEYIYYLVAYVIEGKTITNNKDGKTKWNLILNSDHTGVYDSHEITWKLSANNDENTIAVKDDANGFYADEQLTYDPEEDVLRDSKGRYVFYRTEDLNQ